MNSETTTADNDSHSSANGNEEDTAVTNALTNLSHHSRNIDREHKQWFIEHWEDVIQTDQFHRNVQYSSWESHGCIPKLKLTDSIPD
jgi:hypothetical protein